MERFGGEQGGMGFPKVMAPICALDPRRELNLRLVWSSTFHAGVLDGARWCVDCFVWIVMQM